MNYHDKLRVGYAIMNGDNTTEGQSSTFSGEKMAPVDNALDNWYNPLLDTNVRLAIREADELRRAGLLPPFVEGEPIGVLPRRVRPKPISAAAEAKRHNARMQEQREAMLAMRQHNDETIAALLRRTT